MAFGGLGGLPALQIDTGFLSGASGINAFRQGESDRVESDQRDLMKQVGQTASTGNYLEAAQTAMRGGDMKTGMDISNWDTGRRTKAIEFLNDAAQRADTRERWDAFYNVAEQAFGSEMVGKYRDFNSRPNAMTALQAATLKIQQQNADREAEQHRNIMMRAPLERQVLETQIKAAGQKDVLNEAIAGMIKGALPPQEAQTPPPNPMVQPQSFNSSDTPPGLILTADQNAPPATPNPAPQPNMIDTPMGRMTPERARQLGMALALGGKGEAGKMLTDAVGGPDLGKKTVTDLEERTMNAATQLGRLADINKRFDPKFLDIATRLKLTGASWTAKLGGKLSPENRAELERFAAFRSSSVNNLNTILKEVSGAAVTPQEYERIQMDQPVAGTGIFDGDDPVSFKGKAERVTGALRSAIARFNFMRSHGLNFDRDKLDKFMKLDDVPAAIDARGTQIENQIKQVNPKIDPMTLEQMTHQQLKKEFGI